MVGCPRARSCRAPGRSRLPGTAALTVPTSARPEKEQRTRATHDRKATASGPVVPHTIRRPLPNSREGPLVGEFVRLEVDEASRVGTIRLDRPPVNALNAQI